MPLLHLTLFDGFVAVTLAPFFWINAKILTGERKFHRNESIYIVLASLVSAIALLILVSLRRTFPHFAAYAMPLAVLNMSGSFMIRSLLFLYFWRMKSYSVSKSVVLMFLASMILVVVDHLIGAVWFLFFPAFFTRHALWQLVLYLCFIGAVSVISAYALMIASKRLRSLIAHKRRLQGALVFGSIFGLIAVQVAAVLWRSPGEAGVYLSWIALFLLISALVSIAAFLLYAKIFKQKMIIQQKEHEQKVLQYYTQQIEQQQTAMRKFKHDYQNILLSLRGFIKEKDWDGLEQYYDTKIEPASAVITKDEFTLENLSKIKLPEIKGLLAAKLMMAQNIGMQVHTTFEAHEEIDQIAVDSVTLVRMLGIIMDNAIEELQALGAGALMVACYKAGGGVSFVVQNTCRAEIAPIRALKQVGFSTKGAGRGLGLSNLAEMVAAHSDSMTLQTGVEDGSFIQKLRIGGIVD